MTALREKVLAEINAGAVLTPPAVCERYGSEVKYTRKILAALAEEGAAERVLLRTGGHRTAYRKPEARP